MRHLSIFMAVFVTCFISLSFILCRSSAYAQVTKGELSAFRGEVELIREGKPMPLELNMPIVAKDRIKVEEGIAEIKYDDGSILEIRPHTDLTLDQREMKRKIMGIWSKTYLSRLINISRGKISAIIEERKDLVTEFETPTLVAVVKGTILYIEFDEETGTTTVCSDVGAVDVFTHDGWTFMALTDGNCMAVRSDKDEEGNVVGTTIINTGSGDVTVTTPEGETTLLEDMGTSVPSGEAPGPAEPYVPPERPGLEVPGEELPPGLEITLEPASPV